MSIRPKFKKIEFAKFHSKISKTGLLQPTASQ